MLVLGCAALARKRLSGTPHQLAGEIYEKMFCLQNEFVRGSIFPFISSPFQRQNKAICLHKKHLSKLSTETEPKALREPQKTNRRNQVKAWVRKVRVERVCGSVGLSPQKFKLKKLSHFPKSWMQHGKAYGRNGEMRCPVCKLSQNSALQIASQLTGQQDGKRQSFECCFGGVRTAVT